MPHPSAFCAQGWDSTTANPWDSALRYYPVERPKISPERDTGNRTAVSLTGSNGLDPLTCCSTTSPDRTQFRGDEPTRRRLLLAKIAEAASADVDYIQLREKDQSTRDLQSLAENSVRAIREARTANAQQRTALLINSRTDVALAVGADGVHLRSNDVSPRKSAVSGPHVARAPAARSQASRRPVTAKTMWTVLSRRAPILSSSLRYSKKTAFPERDPRAWQPCSKLARPRSPSSLSAASH